VEMRNTHVGRSREISTEIQRDLVDASRIVMTRVREQDFDNDRIVFVRDSPARRRRRFVCLKLWRETAKSDGWCLHTHILGVKRHSRVLY